MAEFFNHISEGAGDKTGQLIQCLGMTFSGLAIARELRGEEVPTLKERLARLMKQSLPELSGRIATAIPLRSAFLITPTSLSVS